MSSQRERPCPRCLLGEVPGAEALAALNRQWIEALPPERRTDESVYRGAARGLPGLRAPRRRHLRPVRLLCGVPRRPAGAAARTCREDGESQRGIAKPFFTVL